MTTEADLWIDVVCRGNGRNETVCTLFARQAFASPLQIDESLSFHQLPDSREPFLSMTAGSSMESCSVTVTVEEIRQYDVRGRSGIEICQSIRCSPVYVVSESDARIVCNFMIRQFSFEIDPYTINKLSKRLE